jgi:hypothetical protein
MSNLPHSTPIYNYEQETYFESYPFFSCKDSKTLSSLYATHYYNLEKNVESISLCYVKDTDQDIPLLNITEFPLKSLIEPFDSSTESIYLSLNIEKTKIQSKLPKYYIDNNIIPILVINYADVTPEFLNRNFHYKLIINNEEYNVYYYKLLVFNMYIYIIPMCLSKRDEYIKYVKTTGYTITVDGQDYQIYCQRVRFSDQLLCLKPDYFMQKRPYPLQVYFFAILMYLRTDLSQREVAELTKELFNLKKFDQSTLSRFLKSLHIKLSNKEIFNITKSQLSDVNTERDMYSTKLKYNYMDEIIFNGYINRFNKEEDFNYNYFKYFMINNMPKIIFCFFRNYISNMMYPP